jgi:hypothetical protein
MTIEGNGNTLEQDIVELPQECERDDAENITTNIVPTLDLPHGVEPPNESDQSKSSHQGNSYQMDSQSGSSIQSKNQCMRSHNNSSERCPTTHGSDHFHVDTELDRRSRKGRGTRSAKFHEEFGYETVVADAQVTRNRTAITGEILSFTTVTTETPNITSMGATTDPDTMYFHQAMKQADAKNFLGAVHNEFNNLLQRGVFEIVPTFLVPEEMKVFSSVWSMRRKRKVRTREVYKYKARLNLDGSQMQPGRDYDLTYAPVASWESIRMVLALSLRYGWKTKQLDYVLAFPQAPVERECYMHIPHGMVIGDSGNWVLRVKKNIYGQKQVGRVWNEHLVKKLTSPAVGFVQSKYDECIFFHKHAVYVLYTDDSILADPDESELDLLIVRIKSVGLDITNSRIFGVSRSIS